MAHFAELDAQNVVVRVIVVGNKDCMGRGIESESAGIAFCQSLLGANTRWVQTSYSGSSRGKFAVIGDIYDKDKDVFLAPKLESKHSATGETGSGPADPQPVPPVSEQSAIVAQENLESSKQA